MEIGPSFVYIAGAASFALALLVTPLARKVALRLGIMDAPDQRKLHVEPVPYLGGAGLLVALAALAIPSGVLGGAVALLGVALLFGLMGFFDDLRGGLSPRLRLAVQVAAALLVFIAGVRVTAFENILIDLPLTILWIVGITNAFNLLDNMDGLCAGTATIASIFFTALAIYNGQWLVGMLAATVAGFTIGFLIFNFSPARIFLGDMGSLTLGFMLAIIGLQLRFPELPHSVSFAIPVLVLGLAVFDTTLVTILRKRDGVPISQGGKDHVSHRLVNLGMTHKRAVGTLWVVSAGLGTLALALTGADFTQAAVVMLAVTFFAVVGGYVLSFVPVERRPSAKE